MREDELRIENNWLGFRKLGSAQLPGGPQVVNPHLQALNSPKIKIKDGGWRDGKGVSPHQQCLTSWSGLEKALPSPSRPLLSCSIPILYIIDSSLWPD